MSGSRLPGDSESNDRHKIDTRAAARLPEPLAERFEEYAAKNGETKSDVIREALDEFLPEKQTPEFVLPKDPELADAYKQLARRGTKRLLSVEKAIDILAQTTHTNTPKQLIQDDVLIPLENSGLIGVQNGKMGIHPLTPIEDHDGTSDDSEPESDEIDVSERLEELADAEQACANGGTV